MNFIRNRNFRAGPQTSLEGFICPQNSDKQQKIKVFGRSGGVTYNDVVPECYIITMDGLESEPFADVAPYIFEDLGRAYAVVKKQYRNTDLKKHVIGLNLVEIHSLDSVYQKFTWPMWECIESMHNGAILIKKARLIKQKVLSLHREHKQWPFTYVLDKSS